MQTRAARATDCHHGSRVDGNNNNKTGEEMSEIGDPITVEIEERFAKERAFWATMTGTWTVRVRATGVPARYSDMDIQDAVDRLYQAVNVEVLDSCLFVEDDEDGVYVPIYVDVEDEHDCTSIVFDEDGDRW